MTVYLVTLHATSTRRGPLVLVFEERPRLERVEALARARLEVSTPGAWPAPERLLQGELERYRESGRPLPSRGELFDHALDHVDQLAAKGDAWPMLEVYEGGAVFSIQRLEADRGLEAWTLSGACSAGGHGACSGEACACGCHDARARRAYIAGPMTGLPDHNAAAFDAKRLELEAQGFEVVSPADIARAHGVDLGKPLEGQGVTLETLMRADFAALVGCDALFLLEGWEASYGTSRELQVARDCGLPVFLPGAQEPAEVLPIGSP